VTPASAQANNGNWRTAERWARMLRPAYRVQLAQRWEGGDEALMIALHARKSAAAVAAWRGSGPGRPLLLVLTGTDLYRDIEVDEEARRSLDLADMLVVLNERGPRQLPAALRPKCRVVLQSSPQRRALEKTTRHLRAVVAGHLRDEKDPRTCWRAVRRLSARSDIRLDHIGAALDATLGAEATALAATHAGFRWLGGLSHEATRRHIQRGHVLVHPSRMEGGAQVVIEALRAGTPVLVSAIDGNLGLVGDDYPGVFEAGDDGRLASLLERARDEPGWIDQLAACAAARSSLFAPDAERETLRGLVDALAARGASVCGERQRPAAAGALRA